MRHLGRGRTGRPSALLATFSGIDGSGKSTLISAVAERLRQRGLEVETVQLVARHTPFFDRLEALIPEITWQSFCDIVAFERYRAACDRITELQSRFDVLLFDRYLYSDYAYAEAHNCELRLIKLLMERAPAPDLSLLCDVPVEVAMSRLRLRDEIWSVQENVPLLERARRAFLELVASGTIMLQLDTSRPLEDTVESVCNAVNARLDSQARFEARNGV